MRITGENLERFADNRGFWGTYGLSILGIVMFFLDHKDQILGVIRGTQVPIAAQISASDEIQVIGDAGSALPVTVTSGIVTVEDLTTNAQFWGYVWVGMLAVLALYWAVAGLITCYRIDKHGVLDQKSWKSLKFAYPLVWILVFGVAFFKELYVDAATDHLFSDSGVYLSVSAPIWVIVILVPLFPLFMSFWTTSKELSTEVEELNKDVDGLV